MPERAAPDDVFCLPDLGEGLSNAEIVSWHVAVGDRVIEGQPLVSVETDKAVVEIPAPRSAFIAQLHGSPGDIVEVGGELVTFANSIEQGDAGAVVGRLPSVEPETEKTAETPAEDEARPRVRPPAARHAKASPKARRRARELGVDLENVMPGGEGALIQVADVEAAARAPGRLRGVRRAMAARMADAHLRVARATVTGEADVSPWIGQVRPMPRIVRAIGNACAAAPQLNAHFDDAQQTLTLLPEVDLGIAVETEDGLFVPVLHDVRSHTAADIADELARLGAAVRERSIGAEELRGQSITLSNFGAVEGLHAHMIVVPPQVAIVGTGRAFERVVLTGATPAQCVWLPLSISFDHRVVTGVEACRFLAALRADLELPE